MCVRLNPDASLFDAIDFCSVVSMLLPFFLRAPRTAEGRLLYFLSFCLCFVLLSICTHHINPHTQRIPSLPSGIHTPRPLSQSKHCRFVIRWASHSHLSEQSRLPVAHTTESVTPSQKSRSRIPFPSTRTTIGACTSGHTTVWAIYLILITAHNGSTRGESQ